MGSRITVALAIIVGCLIAVWIYHGFIKARFLGAVRKHDLKGVRRHVGMWPGLVNTTEIHKTAAIHRAVETNDVDMLSLLIKYGADVNQPALYSGLPLYIAASQCTGTEMLRILLDAGAEVEGRSPYATGAGETALHIASGCRCLSNMRILLDRGADPNARDRYGYTSLHNTVAAAGEDDDERIQAMTILLDAGADINAKSKNGETPLSMLASNDPRGKRERLRQFLLSHGAVP